jgi:hypothetical protein
VAAKAVGVDVDDSEELASCFLFFGGLAASPADDFEVLRSTDELLDDAIEQRSQVHGRLSQDAEFLAFQFDPELIAEHVLDPPVTKKAWPVHVDPVANRRLPDVVASALALDVLLGESFL